MIDTHCHLLPGVDDGPATPDDAVLLAHELVAQGVNTVVCTPHWSRLFPTAFAEVTAAYRAIRDRLRDEQLSLALVLAAELSDVVAATRPIDEIRERSIRGHWVVVELGSRSLPVHADTIVRRLEAGGLHTVLAHPERCHAVQEDIGLVDRWRAAGALVQVVAPSLTGQTGRQVEETAWGLLLGGRADLLASDAHDVDRRRCELAEAATLVADRCGDSYAAKLTVDGPSRLFESAAAADEF